MSDLKWEQEDAVATDADVAQLQRDLAAVTRVLLGVPAHPGARMRLDVAVDAPAAASSLELVLPVLPDLALPPVPELPVPLALEPVALELVDEPAVEELEETDPLGLPPVATVLEPTVLEPVLEPVVEVDALGLPLAMTFDVEPTALEPATAEVEEVVETDALGLPLVATFDLEPTALEPVWPAPAPAPYDPLTSLAPMPEAEPLGPIETLDSAGSSMPSYVPIDTDEPDSHTMPPMAVQSWDRLDPRLPVTAPTVASYDDPVVDDVLDWTTPGGAPALVEVEPLVPEAAPEEADAEPGSAFRDPRHAATVLSELGFLDS